MDIYTDTEKEKYFQRRKKDVSWKIADASSKGIDIQLTFKDKAAISKDFDEQLTIATDFKDFEPNFPHIFKVLIP